MNTVDKIKSIRETLDGGYKKLPPEQQEQLYKALHETPEALEYLTKRGLSIDTIKHFKLGYDANRNAVSIPVFKRGELVNMRYRFIAPDAKQRYSQERGCEVWLYNDDGIDKGIEKKGVLIVEGEFDLMSAWQAGFKNVVSPASGKDSYGPWIELLDAIPRVYIAYDNDKAGKKAGIEMANRIGVDKSFEVFYGDDVKDANEYFMSHTSDEFRERLKGAQAYYKRQFKGVGDVIESLRKDETKHLELPSLPYVKLEEDWLTVLSGRSNAGKTTWALNLAAELAELDMPVLVLPFERGVRTVGKRLLQVLYNKQEDDFSTMVDEDWDKMRDSAANLPIYFAMPTEKDLADTIIRAKRFFNVKAVVFDHLDYFIRGNDKVSKQADMIMRLKTLAEENGIMFFVVHHIHKQSGTGRMQTKPTLEDLKGASDIYQIAEVVGLLYKKSEGTIDVLIEKNKGPMGERVYDVDMSTGKFMKHMTDYEKVSELIDDDEW